MARADLGNAWECLFATDNGERKSAGYSATGVPSRSPRKVTHPTAVIVFVGLLVDDCYLPNLNVSGTPGEQGRIES